MSSDWEQTDWEKAGRAEIEGLHDFLVGWLGGTLPRTAATFAQFTGVVAPEFIIIGPTGEATEGMVLMAGLEDGYGVHAGKSFAIRIENVRLLGVLGGAGGGHALFTYEEWQEIDGAIVNARLSSVLFDRDGAAPNGMVWRHLHETWLPGHAPEA